jgi:hypothetical protein
VKILVVTQYFWPESFRINDVVSTLFEKGLHVDVLTGKPNYPEGEIYNNYKMWGCQTENKYGANIYRVPLFPRGSNNKIRIILNYLSFIFFGVIMGAWMVRKNKYDLVFVYGLSPILLSLPGIFISKIKRIKIILWVQDLWPESLTATKSIENKFPFLKKVPLICNSLTGPNNQSYNILPIAYQSIIYLYSVIKHI